jgi:phytol kinase
MMEPVTALGPELLLRMVAIASAYAALFGLAEVARRSWYVSAELTRKGVHVGGGLLALALPLLFDSFGPVLLLALAFVGLLGVTARARWLSSIHGVPRRTLGAFLFPIAVAVIFGLGHDDFPRYALAILALSFGDATAGLVGQRFGRHPYRLWGTTRTLEGSAAALVATALTSGGVLLWAGVPDVAASAILVALAASLAEAISPDGTDNATIPLATFVAVGGPGLVVLVVGGALAALAVAVLVEQRPQDRWKGRTPRRTESLETTS